MCADCPADGCCEVTCTHDCGAGWEAATSVRASRRRIFDVRRSEPCSRACSSGCERAHELSFSQSIGLSASGKNGRTSAISARNCAAAFSRGLCGHEEAKDAFLRHPSNLPEPLLIGSCAEACTPRDEAHLANFCLKTLCRTYVPNVQRPQYVHIMQSRPCC